MDFALSDEHEAFRQFAREWVDKFYPKSRALELEAAEGFPYELWDDLTKAGFHGIGIDERYGGQGGDTLMQVILAQELTRNLGGLSGVWGTPSFAGGRSISEHGNEEQKQRFLPGLANGELRFSISVTEPAGGTDLLGAMRTRATKVDGGWRIKGQKIWSTGAHVADYLLVLALSDPDAKRTRAMTLFLVPTDSEGLEIRGIPKLGMRSFGSNEVFYDDVFVPDDLVLGEVNEGWRHIVSTLNNERTIVAGFATGIIEGVLEEAIRYANERTVFGKPLGQMQVIQHYIADMATWKLESELLTRYAAWLDMGGLPSGTAATMAKMVASDRATQAADLGIQILGGMGYSMETHMQRYWRDSRIFRIAPIANEMARNMIGESLGLPRSF